MSRSIVIFAFLFISFSFQQVDTARADDEVRKETRVDKARARFGVTGNGVIIAVFDRGIDYAHPDFRNEDGTSRILYILDLTDNAGADDSENTAGIGTLYTKEDIDVALASGTRLDTRDASGHGTATAGLAGGNGRASNGRYTGMAPEASFIIVKFTSEGVPAHDGEPAEAAFYQPELFPIALDFVLEKANELALPVVALANFGSAGGPMDGTSALARAISDRFGTGKPGRVFVTGTSDDGGMANHAGGSIVVGKTAEIKVHKGHTDNLRFSLYYDAAARYDVTIVTPSGSNGPYAAPDNESGDMRQENDFTFYHNGSEVDFFGATSDTREIMIDFGGPVGDYVVRLSARSAGSTFNASLYPSNIYSHPGNRFDTYVVEGHTVWDWAAADGNIAPNSYVLRTSWVDADGITRTEAGNETGAGALWPGSGIGPTYDGRTGVTISAPGNTNIAPLAARSYRSTLRHVIVQKGEEMYGMQGAVSGAAPVVTGIIALMLQVDPSLDVDQVRTILQQTARQDAFTGEVPNPQWGFGKIDALAAVAAVLGEEPNSAPTAAVINAPESGSYVNIGGVSGEPPAEPATLFTVEWRAAADPEGDSLIYAWELSTNFDFTGILLRKEVGAATSAAVTLREAADIMDDLGASPGQAITLFHHVVTSDGQLDTDSEALTVTLVRGSLVAVENGTVLPETFELGPNYPNPFNPQTTIPFAVPETGRVRVAVYDLLGREVAVLVDAVVQAGRYTVVFAPDGLASGVYLCRFEAAGTALTRTLIFAK